MFESSDEKTSIENSNLPSGVPGMFVASQSVSSVARSLANDAPLSVTSRSIGGTSNTGTFTDSSVPVIILA